MKCLNFVLLNSGEKGFALLDEAGGTREIRLTSRSDSQRESSGEKGKELEVVQQLQRGRGEVGTRADQGLGKVVSRARTTQAGAFQGQPGSEKAEG